MLDEHGYRPNVGIILINDRRQVFWGKRVREHAWQFPQGGIKTGEDPVQAMYRELEEETGLRPHHVEIIGRTRDWLHYDVPDRWVRREWRGHYKGQKQIWFLLRMLGQDSDVTLRCDFEKPEFDAWRWHEFWVPEDELVRAHRQVTANFTQAVHESVEAGLKIATAMLGGVNVTTATDDQGPAPRNPANGQPK